MFIILFGVTGVGKSTIGVLLAQQLGWKFYDADDYHSAANVKKMSAGAPLTDDDRYVWLASLRTLIETCIAEGDNSVLACSALKASYRKLLQVNEVVHFAYLKAEPAWITERLKKRHGHFMNPALVKSQFDTLEEPEAGTAVVIDVAQSPERIVTRIRSELGI
ncbi:MAG: gluconokinase [Burkholderiales bacterium]|nr:gluconokinase [Burkholderiales bacterium]